MASLLLIFVCILLTMDAALSAPPGGNARKKRPYQNVGDPPPHENAPKKSKTGKIPTLGNALQKKNGSSPTGNDCAGTSSLPTGNVALIEGNACCDPVYGLTSISNHTFDFKGSKYIFDMRPMRKHEAKRECQKHGGDIQSDEDLIMHVYSRFDIVSGCSGFWYNHSSRYCKRFLRDSTWILDMLTCPEELMHICRIGPVNRDMQVFEFGGYEFILDKRLMTFFDARRECIERGGILSSVLNCFMKIHNDYKHCTHSDCFWDTRSDFKMCLVGENFKTIRLDPGDHKLMHVCRLLPLETAPEFFKIGGSTYRLERKLMTFTGALEKCKTHNGEISLSDFEFQAVKNCYKFNPHHDFWDSTGCYIRYLDGSRKSVEDVNSVKKRHICHLRSTTNDNAPPLVIEKETDGQCEDRFAEGFNPVQKFRSKDMEYILDTRLMNYREAKRECVNRGGYFEGNERFLKAVYSSYKNIQGKCGGFWFQYKHEESSECTKSFLNNRGFAIESCNCNEKLMHICNIGPADGTTQVFEIEGNKFKLDMRPRTFAEALEECKKHGGEISVRMHVLTKFYSSYDKPLSCDGFWHSSGLVKAYLDSESAVQLTHVYSDCERLMHVCALHYF